MKYLILFLFVISLHAQQINYVNGVNEYGTARGPSIVFIDTTTGTTNNFIFDLNDFYWIDAFPATYMTTGDIGAGSDSTFSATEQGSSSRFYVGTFWANFDNQGTGSPTTDSLLYTIKSYPGVYTDAAKSVTDIDWGTAVTLETIAVKGDYFTVKNVYVHASLTKAFPPEVIKVVIAPSGDADCDDSTAVYTRFAYPAIHQQQKERKVD